MDCTSAAVGGYHGGWGETRTHPRAAEGALGGSVAETPVSLDSQPCGLMVIPHHPRLRWAVMALVMTESMGCARVIVCGALVVSGHSWQVSGSAEVESLAVSWVGEM